MKKGGDGGAGAARADEKARQDRIRKGTADINRLFDGGTTKSGVDLVNPEAYVDGTTYYLENGDPYKYTAPAVSPVTGRPRPQQGVPSKLYANVQQSYTPGQFTDEFFKQRQTAYMDYATPQLNQQYEDARRQLTFALDRAGMTDSSVRAQREAELQQLYDTNRRSVADQALNYSTTARNNVENARADLIATLNATGDAQGAVNSAMTRAKALSAPDTYNPLAQLFTTFTAGLGNQAAIEKAAALSNTYNPGSSVGLYNTGRNSVVNQG